MHVAVVVLGDVGRSPRMQNHVASLAAMPDTTVSFVGFPGEPCIAAVEGAPNVRQHLLTTPFARWPRRLFLLWAPAKVVFQVLQLCWVLLFGIPRPDVLLLQNPPSIPTLLVAWLTARLRCSRLVIDWHNLGFTILALSLHKWHPLVWIAYAYEAIFARLADEHICVTRAMAQWLERTWGVRGARVMHDRAPPQFKPTTVAEAHLLFARLAGQLPPPRDAATSSTVAGTDVPLTTLFTEATPLTGAAAAAMQRAMGGVADLGVPAPFGDDIVVVPAPETATATAAAAAPPQFLRISHRPGRQALIVSSTSWTADEDFGILLNALVAYDAAAAAASARAAEAGSGGKASTTAAPLPSLVVVVTGKGPDRAMYEARFATLGLRHVAIRTLWLSNADYPRMLGAADLGVCLHYSSSGLDLPMKVVDMFGAGLPVCAVGYPCLNELVQHGHNGLVFRTSSELTKQLMALLAGFPGTAAGGSSPAGSGVASATMSADEPAIPSLATLRTNVRPFSALDARWQAEWDREVRSLFLPRAGGAR